MARSLKRGNELIGIAGGADIFPERARSHAAAGRTVNDPQEVVRARPDVILGSWCGKKFRPEHVAARPGWAEVPAVREGELHEIKSVDILQPRPVVRVGENYRALSRLRGRKGLPGPCRRAASKGWKPA